MTIRTESLTSGGLRLALHTLADGEGRPLLLLHGLGEESPTERPGWTAAWPVKSRASTGPGHGESEVPIGGGYMPESLMADVDAVLGAKGPCTLVGRGLGAWVALLISGARPELVRGAVLADGSGLAGGGPQPPSPYIAVLPAGVAATPDPFALLELSRDPRPPDYALDFVRFAIEGSELENPIVVSARIRPEWVAAVAADLDVLDLPLVEAVAHLAAL